VSYILIAKEERRARKPHQCIYCYQAIAIGERYFHERCLFEGEPQSNQWHPECWDAFLEIVHAEGGYAEYTPGEGERPKQVTVTE
jgi:hypothetical protein